QFVVPAWQSLRGRAPLPLAAGCRSPHARHDRHPVAGRGPALDLPGSRLVRVEVESVDVEEAHVRVLILIVGRVAGVVDDLDRPVVAVADAASGASGTTGSSRFAGFTRFAGLLRPLVLRLLGALAFGLLARLLR